MTSAKSGARSGSKLRLILASAAITAALLGGLSFWGPTWLLKLYLDRFGPRQTGLTISYERAEAGFNFFAANTLALDGLVLAGPRPGGLGRLVVGRARLQGWTLLGLWRLGRAQDRPAHPADELTLEEVKLEQAGWTFSAASLTGLDLEWPLGMKAAVSGQDLVFTAPGFPGAPRITLNKGTVALGRSLYFMVHQSWQLSGLAIEARNEAGLWNFSLESLASSSLLPEDSFNRLAAGEITLDLGFRLEDLNLKAGPARLTRDGRAVADLKAAVFETQQGRGSDPTSVRRAGSLAKAIEALVIAKSTFAYRALDLTLNPAELADFPGAPYFWAGLADLVGGPLDLSLVLEMRTSPDHQTVHLSSLRLWSDQLGRLELTAELDGLKPDPTPASPRQLLAALLQARLGGLTLAFRNRGLLEKYYAGLAEAGLTEAGPAYLKKNYLAPLVQTLAGEAGLDNLPALAAEAETFLDRPESFKITVAPPRPLTFWRLAGLAGKNKYDIMEKLNLTLAVNGRPPVAVTAAAGVFPERLPAAARPGLILEEDLPSRSPAE
jgi:hypothetical protein